MKKFFKLGKRMLALFIIVLLNINTYAAVGANDGSAFVTKAEFDALINTFNEQMDSYQSGLNAKIDGAIANYLAGLSSYSATNIDSYIENMREADLTFYNNSAATMWQTGTTSKIGVATNFVLSAYRAGQRSGFVRGNSNGTGTYTLVYDYSADRFTDRKIFIDKATINGVDGYYPNITDVTTCVVRPNHLISGQYTNVSGAAFTTDVALPTTTNWNISSTVRIPGNNTCNGGTAMSQTLIFEVNHALSYVNGESTPNYLKYIPACDFNNKNNMDQYGIIYLNRYDLDSASQVTVDDVKGEYGGCKAYDYITQTSVGERGSDKFTYKFYEPKTIIKTPFTYINYTASVQYNDIIEKKDGIPIVTVDQPCTLEIPLNFVNSTGRCTVAIRKTRFGITEPSTTQATADIYWNDNVPSGDLDKIVIEQTDSTKTTYWLKVLPNNAGATSEVSLYGKVRLIVQ